MPLRLDPERNHRAWLFLTLVKAFVPPLFVASLVVRVAGLDSVLRIVLFILSPPLWWTIKVSLNDRRQASLRESYAAAAIPKAVGRWPGNLDIGMRIGEANSEGHMEQALEPLFDGLGSDTINVPILWQDLIFTRDPQVIQNVCTTSFSLFDKGPTLRLLLYGLMGDGIFISEGDDWKAHRALTKPSFAKERVNNLSLFQPYADKVIDILRQSAERDEAIDVQDVCLRFMVDTAGEFLFGTTEFNTLDKAFRRPRSARSRSPPSSPSSSPQAREIDSSTSKDEFGHAIEQIQLALPKRFSRGDIWPAWELFHDLCSPSNAKIDEVVMPLVNKALEAKALRGEKSLASEDGCLTDLLADSTQSPALIRDELMNVLFAARDTTACLVAFALWMLACHPEVSLRLREEISVFAPNETEPSFENLRQMKYLRATLNETLRLWSPVKSNQRTSKQACLLPSARSDGKPLFMPGPGVPITWVVDNIHRRREFWGEDANQFKPERWLDEASDRISPSLASDSCYFLPFHAGPRLCLGQDLAYNQAAYLLTKVLQHFHSFEVRQAEDAPPHSIHPSPEKLRNPLFARDGVWVRNAMTLYAQGGLWIAMKTAKS